MVGIGGPLRPRLDLMETIRRVVLDRLVGAVLVSLGHDHSAQSPERHNAVLLARDIVEAERDGEPVVGRLHAPGRVDAPFVGAHDAGDLLTRLVEVGGRTLEAAAGHEQARGEE